MERNGIEGNRMEMEWNKEMEKIERNGMEIHIQEYNGKKTN